MIIQFDERVPIYVQIMNIIKKDIITMKTKRGDKLSSVRELADTLKVNPNTVQRAYQELERENVTYTQRGMGTFITEDGQKLLSLKKEMAKEIIITFVVEMKSLGYSPDEIVRTVLEHLKGEN